jgi:phage terminase large subunit-like protein
LRSRAD